MKIKTLIRETLPGKQAIVIDRDEEKVEIVSHKVAVERTFSGLGCIALNLEKSAAVFDRFWTADADYLLADMVQASGLSPAGVTRLIAAGAIRASIRHEPGKANAERARVFSKADLFVCAILGNFRRNGAAMPDLVRAGQLLQKLLATPQSAQGECEVTPATESQDAATLANNTHELVEA